MRSSTNSGGSTARSRTMRRSRNGTRRHMTTSRRPTWPNPSLGISSQRVDQLFLPARKDSVVPIPVEVFGLHPDGRELLVADLGARRVSAGVQFGPDGEPLLGGRPRDQVDDDFVADERSTAPVLGDVAEHPMLDLG